MLEALGGVEGTAVASSHQSHAYTDGACLYFTFAGRPPADLGPADHREWVAQYYRRAWDEVTGATTAAGGAISHHHGIGINRARFLPDALGSGLRVLASVKQALDPHGILNPGKLGLASPFGPVPLAMSILVVDVGTSGVRGAVVRPDGTVEHIHHVPVLPDTPFPGLVEFDAVAMAAAVVEVASASLAAGGPVEAVGIANQRASTIVWDRATGVPVGPGARLAGPAHRGHLPRAPGPGIRVAPNASATKVAALLDMADPDRARSGRGELAFGTVDTWVAWTLSGGSLHVTDASNAGVTGLVDADGTGWNAAVLAGAAHPRVAHARHRRLLRHHRRRRRSSPAGR